MAAVSAMPDAPPNPRRGLEARRRRSTESLRAMNAESSGAGF